MGPDRGHRGAGGTAGPGAQEDRGTGGGAQANKCWPGAHILIQFDYAGGIILGHNPLETFPLGDYPLEKIRTPGSNPRPRRV